MRVLKIALFVLFLYIIRYDTFSQSYTFMHLGAKDGLSQSAINAIYQDELGRMWFATRGGLDRYDGNRIKVYHPVLQDASYFPAISKIDAIHGDNKGFLYLRTHGKLLAFDMRTETFEALIDESVSASGSGRTGIWLALNKSIYLFDTESRELTWVYDMKGLSFVSLIYEDSNGICWIALGDQFFSLDANKTLKRYFSDRQVRRVEEDEDGNLWFITSKGLVKRDTSGAMKYFAQDPLYSTSLIGDNIRASCIDKQGKLWIGSRAGLCRMDTKTEEVEYFNPIYGRAFGLNSQSVMCLYADKQSTVWVGTFFKGVNYINIGKQPFTFHYERNGKPFPVVGKFEEDKRGTIWICTEGGGLCSYDPKTKTFQSYSEEENGLRGLNFKAIRYDEKDDCLWLTSIDSPIIRFDLKTKRAFEYEDDGEKFFVTTVAVASLGDTLLLGGQYGLIAFDPATGKTEAFPDEETSLGRWVSSIVLDSNRRLWVATLYEGLKCYDLTTRTLTSFAYNTERQNGLSLNEINVLFEDSRQRIWIGTKGGGLNLYRPESNDFEVMRKESRDLLDNTILALSETPSGLLLIGTARGLSTLHPDEGVFRHYDYKQGFPLVGVNDGSLYVSDAGAIYVGGVDGMTVFTEKDLRSASSIPFDIQFSALFVDNVEVRPGDKTGILQHTLPFTEEIRLKHGYFVFAVEFTTDNYVGSQFGEVEYRLRGYETQWTASQFGRMLSYTNLGFGRYVLELRSKEFPEKTRSIAIQLLPPFYLTWPAYLLYLACGFGMAYWLIKQARIRFYLKTSLAFEHKEKQRNEELIQSKLRFFTNVSHEFRTPITLIMGQAETLLRSYQIHPMAYSKILHIYKNATNLKSLISELLDFQKQEQGHLKLKVSKVDLIPFVEEIFFTFKEYALNKKIDFEFSYTHREIELWFDPEQMQKVVNNLLSNAFKYASSGNKVKILVEEKPDVVALSVVDNGIGIDQDALEHVFERFYQANTVDATVGTGIGLSLAKGIVDAHRGEISVKSQPGEGATFTVCLKKGCDHFTKEERCEDRQVTNLIDQETITQWADETAEVFPTDDRPKEDPETLPVLLIVEDNKELRDILVESFSRLYRVLEAVDGQEGWERVVEHNPDLVISDVAMPRMSGVELCSKIKNGMETCHIPVVLLTAKTAFEHKFEGLRTGADDYITKPFDLKLLIVRSNNLINTRKMLQKKFINNKEAFAPQVATNASDQELLNKATKLALDHIADDQFDVDRFAQEMNLGRTTFFNKLKAITGLTPNQFVVNIRLKKAAELLVEKNGMNVSEVAYAVGFTSPYYFSRCFKEQFGFTPVGYKRKNQKET